MVKKITWFRKQEHTINGMEHVKKPNNCATRFLKKLLNFDTDWSSSKSDKCRTMFAANQDAEIFLVDWSVFDKDLMDIDASYEDLKNLVNVYFGILSMITAHTCNSIKPLHCSDLTAQKVSALKLIRIQIYVQ